MDCSKVNIKSGTSGSEVTELQKYLTYLGYYNGKINGICGNLTVTAIKKLQEELDLVVDGNFAELSCKASSINGKDVSTSTLTLDLATWLDMKTRHETYVKEKGKEPHICYIDKENPYQYITNIKYKDILSRYNQYISSNGRKPNFVYINYPKTITTTPHPTTSTTSNSNKTYYLSTPHFIGNGCNKLGQCNSYNCGPHSLHQCLCKLGVEKYSELTLASWAGTTTSGTGHSGLNTALKQVNNKLGKTFKLTWMNFSDLGSTTSERFKALGEKIQDANTDAIIHSLYRNKYGHYEVIKSINTKTSTVQVLNSLGTKSNGKYNGYIENRSFNTFASYIANTSGGQPSIGLITTK